MPRNLYVTSPLMAGRSVLAVQKRLAALGYPPGPLDGRYGVATASAVTAFQAEHGLEADRIVGPLTRAALRRGHPAAVPDGRSSPLGLEALAEATRHLGTTEKPSGSNRTPFGRWFGIDGIPWCNVFVSYCFAVGAGYLICAGFRGAGVTSHGCTYVPTTEAWLRATGMWIGRSDPAPGDLAIYDWDGGAADHIGIVERDLGGGEFTAIEGNSSIGDSSNGGSVLRRLRYTSQVHGFGRVRA